MNILSAICQDNNISVVPLTQEIAEISQCRTSFATIFDNQKYIFLHDTDNYWEKSNVAAHELAHHLLGHLTGDLNGEVQEMEARIFAAVFTAIAIWDKYSIKAEKEDTAPC